MSAWRRSGAAVRLLAVLCATAGCAATQQQQQQRRCHAANNTEPRDCSDLAAGSASGVYDLRPGPDLSVEAYCDMETDGGGWTVFQRRANITPRQDFYLNWTSYSDGFGSVTNDGEFWMGLQYLSALTLAPDRQYQLRVDLEAFDGNKTHADYQGFQISSEKDGYILSVYNYSGDAGDSLSVHNNHKFSTRDRDQDGLSDKATISCATYLHGAWWYNSCADSSLNGRYLVGGVYNITGIFWFTWKGWQSLKTTEMKIRPIKPST